MPDTEAVFPSSVVDVQVLPDALVVTGYDCPIRARWDYLNGAIITARFTSPMPNVIRVQLTHFKGRRERLPEFDLDYTLTNPNVSTGQDDQHVWLKTDDISCPMVLVRRGHCTSRMTTQRRILYFKRKILWKC